MAKLMVRLAPRAVAVVCLALVSMGAMAMNAHDFTFPSIDGGDLALKDYKGKPVLVVNTASFCGYTGQYETLQALWEKYEAKGLVVVGVPSNDFGGHEPGSKAEIKQFCEANFGVTFPMTDKQVVAGSAAHPFSRWIAAPLGEAGSPQWNFHKYLIGGDGALIGAWPSDVEPTSREVTQAVDAALRR